MSAASCGNTPERRSGGEPCSRRTGSDFNRFTNSHNPQRDHLGRPGRAAVVSHKAPLYEWKKARVIHRLCKINLLSAPRLCPPLELELRYSPTALQLIWDTYFILFSEHKWQCADLKPVFQVGADVMQCVKATFRIIGDKSLFFCRGRVLRLEKLKGTLLRNSNRLLR